MELAQRHFNIPLVLEPEYLASPHLDELSGMTYLSYFMKVMLMQIGNIATLQIEAMLRRFVFVYTRPTQADICHKSVSS